MSASILRAGAGAAPIAFPAETFPTDGIMGVHDDPYFRVLAPEQGENGPSRSRMGTDLSAPQRQGAALPAEKINVEIY